LFLSRRQRGSSRGSGPASPGRTAGTPRALQIRTGRTRGRRSCFRRATPADPPSGTTPADRRRRVSLSLPFSLAAAASSWCRS